MAEKDDIIEHCLRCSSREFKEILNKAFENRLSRFGRRIHFFIPGMIHYETPIYTSSKPYGFPAISITGALCELQCKHCRGMLLRRMLKAENPNKLYELCRMLKLHGGTGCLISGGSLKDGSVPLYDFIPVIKQVREELGLKVLVHTGLPHPETVKALADVGVDGILIDIIGSDETIRDVYNLDRRVEDFEESLAMLERYRLPTIPHLVVGLHYGRLLGEAEALKIISRYEIKALVIVVLMPFQGTDMEDIRPPSPYTVARIMAAARLILRDKPILLGCARPRGPYRSIIDVLGVKAGVNGIAYPSMEGYHAARDMGLEVELHEECCSLIWKYC